MCPVTLALVSTWPGSRCLPPGEGEYGVGAGVPGTLLLAIPSSPPCSPASPSMIWSGWSACCGGGPGLGVGAGVPGSERARSALSLVRVAASWSGLGARCPARPPACSPVGVALGVAGTAGDRTELVELVRLRILRSIINARSEVLRTVLR